MGDKRDKKPTPRSNDPPRMMSLSDLNKEDDNTMYAGGEKSGMALQGQDDEKDRLIRGILDRAQKGISHDHLEPDDAEFEESGENTKNSSKIRAFQGKAQKLGGESSSPSSSLSPSREQSNIPPNQYSEEGVKATKVTRTLTFWSTGFTVSESGPLYSYDDPANQLLLKMLQEGQAPLELFNIRPGQALDVRVAHRMSENFTPTNDLLLPQTSKPFSGTGNRLGDTPDYPASQGSSTTTENPTKKPHQEPEFDSTRPTTLLQIRFGDGTRVSARFNTSSTIADMYRYVQGEVGSRPFTLLSGRPPVTLNADDKRSLEEAGLLNMVVMQQWK